jgi:hypothetical protein
MANGERVQSLACCKDLPITIDSIASASRSACTKWCSVSSGWSH